MGLLTRSSIDKPRKVSPQKVNRSIVIAKTEETESNLFLSGQTNTMLKETANPATYTKVASNYHSI